MPHHRDEHGIRDNGQWKATEPIDIPQSQRKPDVMDWDWESNLTTSNEFLSGHVRFADNLQHPQRLGAADQRGPLQLRLDKEHSNASQKQANRDTPTKAMLKLGVYGNGKGKTPAPVPAEEGEDDEYDDYDDEIDQDVVMESHPLNEDHTNTITFAKRPVRKGTVLVMRSLLTAALRKDVARPKPAHVLEALRMKLYIQNGKARRSANQARILRALGAATKIPTFLKPGVPTWGYEHPMLDQDIYGRWVTPPFPVYIPRHEDARLRNVSGPSAYSTYWQRW
jgi:hypothetical protein